MAKNKHSRSVIKYYVLRLSFFTPSIKKKCFFSSICVILYKAVDNRVIIKAPLDDGHILAIDIFDSAIHSL